MRYGSVARKVFKTRWGLYNKGLVEDHHVIPREFREHPTIKGFGYDMNAGDNIILLPTRLGKHILRVREDRLVHTGNHPAYNAYVGGMLDVIQSEGDLLEFVDFLKYSCRYSPHQIPWS